MLTAPPSSKPYAARLGRRPKAGFRPSAAALPSSRSSMTFLRVLLGHRSLRECPACREGRSWRVRRVSERPLSSREVISRDRSSAVGALHAVEPQLAHGGEDLGAFHHTALLKLS